MRLFLILARSQTLSLTMVTGLSNRLWGKPHIASAEPGVQLALLFEPIK